MAIAADGSVNLRGKAVLRSQTGTWRASTLIIVVEMAERLVYAGIYGNLVTYLTNVMHENTAAASRNVNIWSGVSQILPFLGAFVADSYLGRYWTILWSSLVYLLGLGLVTLTAALKSLQPPACSDNSSFCPEASPFKIGFFFTALYLVALGQGGHKPCLQAFGADQFDELDPKEKVQKASFFNWWYFGISIGTFLGVSVLMYVQDDIGWVPGFGIPALVMVLALFVFVCGTKFYRHKLPGGSPLSRICHVFVATYYKWNVNSSLEKHKAVSADESQSSKTETKRRNGRGFRLRFLDKATVADELDGEYRSTTRNWRLCTVEQVEEVKSVLCLFPIWVACLTFGIVFAQSATLFTKQGSTLDRKIGSFEVPPAALQCFINISIFVLIPVYDRVFVPAARKLTGAERGISLLQRIGVGMFVSAMSMAVSALIEMKRIQTAREHGLTDMPKSTIPLSIFVLLPQYVLFGIADVFTMVGMQEFFYDQMPDKLKSLGIAIYLSILGIGSIASGVLISLVQRLSCRNNNGCWISDNLNQGHLNYFYWFLSALSAFNLCFYIIMANGYQYKQDRGIDHYEEIPQS